MSENKGKNYDSGMLPSAENDLPKGLKPPYKVSVPPSETRAKLLEILGVENIPTNVVYESGEIIENEGLIEYKVEYNNSFGELVEGIIIIPKPEKNSLIPGIVCMGGTAATKEGITESKFHRPNPTEGQLYGWARQLARLGYGTISITLRGSADRRGTTAHWEQETKLLSTLGRTQIGYKVEETLLAARVLGSLDSIDHERIGLTGMSLGGVGTWWSMACDPSISVGVTICGNIGSAYRHIYEGMAERHSSSMYVPGLLKYFDHGEIVANCIAPRPFMMIAPLEDEDMPKDGVNDLLKIVEPKYESTGDSSKFFCHKPPGRHVFSIDYFDRMVSWFDKYLK